MNVLLIDVGNTNIKIGIASEDKLLSTFTIPTEHKITADSFGIQVYELCKYAGFNPKDFSFWLVSSVVPPLDPIIKEASLKFFGCKSIFVPQELSLDIENRYANPQEVGADRLVTAYGARKLLPFSSIIIIDFGTATTLDCVQGNSYLGGLICPGIGTSLKGLSLYTAKLPQISLEVDSLEIKIGDTTVNSMKYGFLFGFAAMIDGLCNNLAKILNDEVYVIATGGFASKISCICNRINEVKEDLLMQGLLFASKLLK